MKDYYEYDVVLVGGGIANIALALKLIDSKYSVALFERGHDISHRSCPKSKTGVCVNCKPSCQITTGFAGAGCFSDTKLTYSEEVGGTLVDYVGQKMFDELMNEADKMFIDNGSKAEFVYNEDFAHTLQYQCVKHGMHLIESKVKHLGTDGSYEVMTNIWNKLNQAKNIDVFCDVPVAHVDFHDNKVIAYNNVEGSLFNPHTQIKYKYLSIAVGRYGSEWLRNLCKYYNIKLENTSVDIGVRVECPRSITDEVTDNLYEFKIVNYSSSENKVRTFCINPGGYVVQENYDTASGKQIMCVNGHSFSDNKSMNTNFALLVSCNFTEPFNQPIKYAQSICQLANMLADDKPMVQRLIDLKNHKRSTESRMKRLSITPTLKGAQPGDLRYVLPSNIIDSIIETLDNISNVIPNINGKNTILYAPEVKFYSSKIELNDKLQNDKFDNVFFIGDGSGVTHGIIQSAMSGIYVANQLLERSD